MCCRWGGAEKRKDVSEHREMQCVRKGPFLGHSGHLINQGAAVC